MYPTTLNFKMPRLSNTLQMHLYGLEHGFKINGFKPTWSCLTVEVHATRAKFLESSGLKLTASSPFALQIFMRPSAALQLCLNLENKFSN